MPFGTSRRAEYASGLAFDTRYTRFIPATRWIAETVEAINENKLMISALLKFKFGKILVGHDSRYKVLTIADKKVTKEQKTTIHNNHVHITKLATS